MASYLDLNDLVNDSTLRTRVTSAIAVAAYAVLQESSVVAARKAWADQAIVSPINRVDEMLWYMLAANAGLTRAQIEGAADSAILTQVNNAINKRVAPPGA